jgi:hypothetical protein
MSAKTHLDSTNEFSGTKIVQIHFLEIPSGDYPKLLPRLLKLLSSPETELRLYLSLASFFIS